MWYQSRGFDGYSSVPKMGLGNKTQQLTEVIEGISEYRDL